MRSAASCLSLGALCAAALIGWVCFSSVASASDEAAHALAEKFSQAAEDGARAEAKRKAEERADTERKAEARARAKAEAQARKQAEAEKRKRAEAQRAADEAELQRSAREEAEARRAADQARTEAEIRREAEAARMTAERQAPRAETERFAEEARKLQIEHDRLAEEKRLADEKRLAEEKRVAEEKRLAEERASAAARAEADRKAEEARTAEEARLAAARADADRKAGEARAAEQRRTAEEARVAEIRRQAEAAEAKRQAEEARVADLKRAAEEAEQKRQVEENRLAEQRRIGEIKAAEQRAALEAQREAEAQRIAEKFRLAREARERGKETRNSLGGPLPAAIEPPASEVSRAAGPTAYPQRVTVLVVMQPRRHGFAGKMTSNPVLCVGDDCYVSNGAAAQASLMRRAQALGPGNTLGRNAGTCRNQTTCVFRGVTLLNAQSTIQPVDMGFWHHDRREIRTAVPDRSCEVGVGGQLFCSQPIVTPGYRAWIVPEQVADKARPKALEQALDHGLPAARSASAGPAAEWTAVQALPTR